MSDTTSLWLSTLVQALQVLNLFAWGAVAYLKAPAALKAARKQTEPGEELVAIGFYFGALQMFFVIRWLLWSSSIANMDGLQLVGWASCYAFSTALAVKYVKLTLKLQR